MSLLLSLVLVAPAAAVPSSICPAESPAWLGGLTVIGDGFATTFGFRPSDPRVTAQAPNIRVLEGALAEGPLFLYWITKGKVIGLGTPGIPGFQDVQVLNAPYGEEVYVLTHQSLNAQDPAVQRKLVGVAQTATEGRKTRPTGICFAPVDGEADMWAIVWTSYPIWGYQAVHD